MRAATDALLEELLETAEAHVLECEPDHEVGDLQALLRACWARLPEAERRSVHREFVAIHAEGAE